MFPQVNDKVTRQDAGKHILCVVAEDGTEHTYTLRESTPAERTTEIRAILQHVPFKWTRAYDATRS